MMNEETKLLQTRNTGLQNVLFEAYLLHLENCEEITPVPDRYVMQGYDEWIFLLASRMEPSHSQQLDRIDILRRDVIQ